MLQKWFKYFQIKIVIMMNRLNQVNPRSCWKGKLSKKYFWKFFMVLQKMVFIKSFEIKKDENKNASNFSLTTSSMTFSAIRCLFKINNINHRDVAPLALLLFFNRFLWFRPNGFSISFPVHMLPQRKKVYYLFSHKSFLKDRLYILLLRWSKF